MRTVKYTMETKKFELKMQIKDEKEWRVLGYSDAEWGSDKQTRLSINGSCLFIVEHQFYGDQNNRKE